MIEYYERLFLTLTLIVLAVFMGAIFYGLIVHQIEVPHSAGQIDPSDVESTEPFNDPGVVEVAPGEYQVNMVARAFSFSPREIRIPVGSSVSFAITTVDVIHGFRLFDTNLNVMLIPGEIAAVKHTFDEPGEYTFVCHEYCGLGHQAMFGTLYVEDTPAAAARADQ